MELVVEIHDVTVDERTVQGNRGEFLVREQSGWLQMPGEPHPRAIKMQIDKDQRPHAEGLYRVTPKSLYVNRYGFLELRKTLTLEPRGA